MVVIAQALRCLVPLTRNQRNVRTKALGGFRVLPLTGDTEGFRERWHFEPDQQKPGH